MKLALLLIFFHACSSNSFGSELRFPTDLSTAQQQETLRLVGPSLSGKILSDPYPLGGFSGIEVSVQHESIPVGSLREFGSRNGTGPTDLTFQKINVGKGLYNDVDVYLSFTPWSRVAGMTQYGAFVRWQFWSWESIPVAHSIVPHANVSNFRNTFISENAGAQLITTYFWREASFYGGVGQVRSVGRFESDLTLSGRAEQYTQGLTHFLLGASYRWNSWLVAAELNRYDQPVWAFKLGARW